MVPENEKDFLKLKRVPPLTRFFARAVSRVWFTGWFRQHYCKQITSTSVKILYLFTTAYSILYPKALGHDAWHAVHWIDAIETRVVCQRESCMKSVRVLSKRKCYSRMLRHKAKSTYLLCQIMCGIYRMHYRVDQRTHPCLRPVIS